jgi:hypothetical protein
MRRVENGKLVFYQFEQWRDSPIKHGIYTRCGGTSNAPYDSLNMGGNVGDTPQNVRHNHEVMYASAGVRGDRACTVWQVHSNDVVIASRPARNRRWVVAADGLISDQIETPLTMRFADCVPILFFDPVRGVTGIAHAGWRGTVAGICAATVRAMAHTFGCKQQDIQAGIGPSIGPSHYQVGEEVVKAISDYFAVTDGLIERDSTDGSAYLDLWAANALDLRRAGVEQIEIARICTAENTHEFYSHRREKGRTGRFGAVISL